MTENSLIEDTCTVAVIGGGTSGLALAAELMRLSAGKVVVLERESEAGGIPRHCGHYPFGIREYGRFLKGPNYARRNWDIAEKSGAEIRTGATVTAVHPNGVIELICEKGRTRLHADRVVLCTGVRESSRAQRFIGGDRPNGVVSTGALQSLVYLKGIKPFERPVIFGSELVSFSAIQTCAHLAMKPVAMVEEENRIVARRVFKPYLSLRRVPLFAGVQEPRIIGRERVEALEFTDKNGTPQKIETDGIIVSGRFRPESALLQSSHLEIDPGTGGPIVDQFGRCSDPAYFAAGNVLRPAETSGYCWREGIETAQRVVTDLKRGKTRDARVVPVVLENPDIQFIVPQRICLSNEPGGTERFYVGLNNSVSATLTANSGGRLLWKGKLNARPARRIQIPLFDFSEEDIADEITFSIAR